MTERNIAHLERLLISVSVFVLIGAGVPQPVAGKIAKPFPRYLAQAPLASAPAVAPTPRSLPKVAAKPRPVRKTLWVTVTAYSSTVDQTDSDPFTTASGERVRDGVAAWNGVPFGTELKLPSHFGDKVFVIKDRLNPRASAYHVDIWMPTRAEAVQWGARVIKVELL